MLHLPVETFIFLAAYFAVINLLTFYVWGADKQYAVAGKRRVPESTLVNLCALGGWPLAIAAAHAFRHKTRKERFITRVGFAIALNVGIVCILIVVL